MADNTMGVDVQGRGKSGRVWAGVWAVLIGGIGLLGSLPAMAASFDCNLAQTAVETAICRDTGLNALDGRLGEVYRQRLQALAARERQALVQAQRDWLRARNRRCSSGDTACLQQALLTRLAELEQGSGSAGQGERATDGALQRHLRDLQQLRPADNPSQPAVPVIRTPYATVNTERLNLRQTPGSAAVVVRELPAGTWLAVLGQQTAGEYAGWVQVRVLEGGLPSGAQGWVAGRFLQPQFALATTPATPPAVVRTPPVVATPTPAPAARPAPAPVRAVTVAQPPPVCPAGANVGVAYHSIFATSRAVTVYAGPGSGACSARTLGQGTRAVAVAKLGDGNQAWFRLAYYDNGLRYGWATANDFNALRQEAVFHGLLDEAAIDGLVRWPPLNRGNYILQSQQTLFNMPGMFSPKYNWALNPGSGVALLYEQGGWGLVLSHLQGGQVAEGWVPLNALRSQAVVEVEQARRQATYNHSLRAWQSWRGLFATVLLIHCAAFILLPPYRRVVALPAEDLLLTPERRWLLLPLALSALFLVLLLRHLLGLHPWEEGDHSDIVWHLILGLPALVYLSGLLSALVLWAREALALADTRSTVQRLMTREGYDPSDVTSLKQQLHTTDSAAGLSPWALHQRARKVAAIGELLKAQEAAAKAAVEALRRKAEHDWQKRNNDG